MNGAYDSEAGQGNLPNDVGGGIANVAGSWVSFSAGGTGNLSVFDGMDANGEWTLNITDSAAGDVGTLNSWGLDITPVPEPSSAFVLFVGMGGLALVRRRK